jgi:hypothetical protein
MAAPSIARERINGVGGGPEAEISKETETASLEAGIVTATYTGQVWPSVRQA